MGTVTSFPFFFGWKLGKEVTVPILGGFVGVEIVGRFVLAFLPQ
jgi:hypothetical protein